MNERAETGHANLLKPFNLGAGRARGTAAVEVSRKFERPDAKWWQLLVYKGVVLGSRWWFYSACEGRIEGYENVEALTNKNFVLCANHGSYLDWMVLHSIFNRDFKKEIAFLAKRSLYEHPLWSSLMVRGHTIAVSDEGNAILEPERLRSVRRLPVVAVFPEGTRSRTGRLQPAHSGAVKLAAMLRRPIIPTALVGFYQSWPPNRLTPRRHSCRIRFGEAIYIDPQCTSDRYVAKKEMKRVMSSIAEMLQ